MDTKTRVELIISHTIDDFHSFLRSTKEDKETLIKWLSDDLMLIEDIEDSTVIEISLLTLKKLNSLDLVNLQMIIETVASDSINSDYEMIHIAMPKVL